MLEIIQPFIWYRQTSYGNQILKQRYKTIYQNVVIKIPRVYLVIIWAILINNNIWCISEFMKRAMSRGYGSGV